MRSTEDCLPKIKLLSLVTETLDRRGEDLMRWHLLQSGAISSTTFLVFWLTFQGLRDLAGLVLRQVWIKTEHMQIPHQPAQITCVDSVLKYGSNVILRILVHQVQTCNYCFIYLRFTSTCLQYTSACFRPITVAWAPGSRQAPSHLQMFLT